MPAPAAVFRTYPACPELRPYICGYLTLTREGAEPARTTLRVLADGSHESRFSSADPLLTCMPPAAHHCISFNFGDPWKIRRGSRTALAPRTGWVSGATTQPGTLDIPRHAETIDVLFHAGVAHNFLRVPSDALTDQVLALSDLWGPEARTLVAQLAECSSAAGRIRVLEAELLRRVRALRWMDTALQPIARLIERERGIVTVERLSRLSGLSRQHLARKFRRQVGVSPKQFCRCTRFHALLNHAYVTPQPDWAALAAEFGYYDQAHLIAEFKEFTGLTPSQFFRAPVADAALAAD
jgi:AraC-like DNA-binding protein